MNGLAKKWNSAILTQFIEACLVIMGIFHTKPLQRKTLKHICLCRNVALYEVKM